MIFPKLPYIITVNDSIAETYGKLYQKKLLVIRNIPNLYKQDTLATKDELGIPSNKFLVIIQGSGLNVERGIEEAVLAMKELTDVILLIVGDGDAMPVVKKLIEANQLQDKVKIFGRRPYHELMQFTCHANLGLTLDKPLSKNYEYSLPNKVFDYMHAGTPILASDLVEVKRVIQTHGIGTILPEVRPNTIAKRIIELKNNPGLLAEQKVACEKASRIENWENEKLKLEKLINSAFRN